MGPDVGISGRTDTSRGPQHKRRTPVGGKEPQGHLSIRQYSAAAILTDSAQGLPAGTVRRTETAGRLPSTAQRSSGHFRLLTPSADRQFHAPPSDCVLSFPSSNHANQNLGTLLNGAASADARDRASCSCFHRCSLLGEGVLLNWLAGIFFFFF